MKNINVFQMVGVFIVSFFMCNIVLGFVLITIPFFKDCTEISYLNTIEKTCTLKSGIAIIANILSLVFAFESAKFARDNPHL